MNNELLEAARATAELIGARIHIAIPSVLAEGEVFTARVSITGPDALPLDSARHVLKFQGSCGIEGLPEALEIPPGQSSGAIAGLRAVGPDTALIQAKVACRNPLRPTATIPSNPAWVFKEPPYRLYFGDLHVHTTYSNCSAWRCLPPEWCYAYARDVSLIDFAAPADHLRGIHADSQRWADLQRLARLHNSPGEFVTFLAFESSHAQGFGGDNNVYYLDDDAPHFWVDRDDMCGGSPEVHLKDLWAQLDGNRKPYFTVPHHTGRARKYRSWDEDYHDPEREPLFEVFSGWGSSEMRHSRFPISGGNNNAPSYYVDALKAGARFGVIASSDDHTTLPGSVHRGAMHPFRIPSAGGYAHKGLAAIQAPELTRQALFDAMRRRNTYATTNARSLLEIKIGDVSMGQAVPADLTLRSQRDLRVRFTLDNSDAARITLMRNGVPLDAKSHSGPELMTVVNEVSFIDADDLEKVALRGAKYHPAPFVVYYARIEDANGEHQWTSPIWIDLV